MYYSEDLRKKALDYHKTHTIKETSKAFGITPSAISAWKKLIKEGKSLKVAHHTRRRRAVDEDKLKEYVKEHPDAYIHEIGEAIRSHKSSVFRSLRRLGITLKKRPKYTEKGMKRGERNIPRKYLNTKKKI